MLQTFLPLFAMTFGICLFIVLMQFLWRYIDDMVGKGLEIPVLAELFFYAALYMVPMALPLAILLASLMTFGNLGERLELLAMKAAGISLTHIMRPLIITLVIVSITAFVFQNNIMPVVQVKLFSLLYSMREKSPELDIPESTFYNGITGFNVYVKEKDNKTGLLKDMMIYDYSEGFNNARVIVADSGRLKTSADKLFLVLSLYNGESFENLKSQGSTDITTAVPYRRESFRYREVLIEFNANFTRTDESFLQNQYVGKNLKDLRTSIDSMTQRLDSVKLDNARSIYDFSYKKSFASFRNRAAIPEPGNEPVVEAVEKGAPVVLNFDSLYQANDPSGKASLLNRARSAIESIKSEYYFRASTLEDDDYKIRRHIIEWHKKFTLSFACMVFFFIGAPLGAIIRKGGLGMPVVISVFLFIIYYIIDNVGFKMARSGVWEEWEGMWLSSAVLAPLGIFLTYKAAKDSVILNADTYINWFKKVVGKGEGRKIERKEVIMTPPDYTKVTARIDELSALCSTFLESNKSRISYISFWKKGEKNKGAVQIATLLEELVEELSNSEHILLLNKLMDYPFLNGYSKRREAIPQGLNLVIALLLPVGLTYYLFEMYNRKLLIHDIGVVQKVSNEVKQIIIENIQAK